MHNKCRNRRSAASDGDSLRDAGFGRDSTKVGRGGSQPPDVLVRRRVLVLGQDPELVQRVGDGLRHRHHQELIVVVDHNPDGSVPRVSVRMSPLGSVLSLASHLRERLSKQLPENLFL